MTDLLHSRSAVFHEQDGIRTHRYRLSIMLGRGPHVAVVGVNPSVADETRNDPTMAKVIGFASRLGWGQISMLNKFAAIATDVGQLRSMGVGFAVGEYNDDHLFEVFRLADLIVGAWGPLSKLPPPLRQRWRMVSELAASRGKPIHCLTTAKDGHPRHPLMLAYATPLTEWRAPE